MTVRRLLSFAGGAACVLGVMSASPAYAQGAPETEKPAAADQIADDEVQAPAQPSDSPLERARQGIVILERAGKVIGVGSVLAGDGRILTALSPLEHGNDVDARFADGTVSRVKVGHTDRAWDLALLVPQNGRWTRGLRASRSSPTSAGSLLRTFSVLGSKAVAPSRTIVKGKRTLLGADNELLPDALEMASRFKTTDIGSPVVDEKGDVVAVIARACAPVANQPCSRVPFGVPVSAVKAFLRTVPTNAVPPAPWLGIQGVAEDSGGVRGVRVIGVHPQSAAAAAGLRGGNDKSRSDMIVAVNGAPVSTPEALAETINKQAVGDSVELLLFSGGKFRQVSLTLRPAPDSIQSRSRKVKQPAKPAKRAPGR